MVQVVYGGRQSGKTVKLIKLCQQLNKEHGKNDTVIVVKSREDARRVSAMADELGYPDMPFPVILDDIRKCRPTYYKKLLIDDMDIIMQRLLSPWEISGYSINYWESEENA